MFEPALDRGWKYAIALRRRNEDFRLAVRCDSGNTSAELYDVAATLPPARLLRFDLRQQVVRHQLLTMAQIIKVRMNITAVCIVLDTLQFVVGEQPLMTVGDFDFLIADRDPRMAQRMRTPVLREQLRLGGGQLLFLKVTAL